MAVHKLILDDVFDESAFTLIAIHCTIEDYRMAYLLNKFLGIRLIRKRNDLDFNGGKTSYSIYDWKDKKHLVTWNLISNICKTNDYLETKSGSLFETVQSITKTYNVLPELKNVNYLLKIDDEFQTKNEKSLINTILSIPQIATAYTIDQTEIKTIDNLIFN